MQPSSAKLLTAIRTIYVAQDAPDPVRLSAEALQQRLSNGATLQSDNPDIGFQIGLINEISTSTSHLVQICLDSEGHGYLKSTHPTLLYAGIHRVCDGLLPEEVEMLEKGLTWTPTFPWHRPVYDTALTQIARTARGFDPEIYIEHLARHGFTHIEVNGLATLLAAEPGRPHEFYPAFYSYGPSLHHFVASTLTEGFYDATYLEANLNRLKTIAQMGLRYGLQPGLLCFEPRTLPEAFFQRYPTLRGARVDHPFRSHLPRYTLAQDHPVSHDHYRQLIRRLLQEIPELAYLSVWTNDSGAGFEHTASLYVGRNGGPYLIREWHDHQKIAETAGHSAIRWLRNLQEAGAEINPDFEVILRIEPFKEEHDVLMAGMGDGLSIEAPSLLVRGYDLPYRHPVYPEQAGIAGTIFHTEMDPAESAILKQCREQGFEPKLSYAAGSTYNMEPLLGIPIPFLIHKRLSALRQLGAEAVSAFGGLHHPQQTPYCPNAEVIRSIQFNYRVSIDSTLTGLAQRFVSAPYATLLVEIWRRIDEAVQRIPFVPLYSVFGFVWYRLWTRPFVPNLEVIPASDRAYYEQFMVTTPNNPSINDLGRDVLFELITRETGRQKADQIDQNVLPRLTGTLNDLAPALQNMEGEDREVFDDVIMRIRALRCWVTTLRNTCAWVYGVYTCLDEPAQAPDASAYLQEMIDLDLANTEELLNLWETAPRDFMWVSEAGETPFVYGENFGEVLKKKIALTNTYRLAEPYIDRDIIWRLPSY